MHNGSRAADDASPATTLPASSMLWVRNLRRFIGSGAGLGSEALMGTSLLYYRSRNIESLIVRLSVICKK